MENVKHSSIGLAFDSTKKTNNPDYLDQISSCKNALDILDSIFEEEFELAPVTINIPGEGEYKITTAQIEKFIINCKYHRLVK